MKKKVHLFNCIIAVIGCVSALPVCAQRDSTKRQSIDITSSYKPVLRNAVKINLSASPIAADTNRPRLAYAIPSQQLFFSYQPITLKPLSLSQDTALQLGARNFVKAGFGNFSTPYINAGLSFGDGKQGFINIYGNYISSKGKIENQDFSRIKLKATGSWLLIIIKYKSVKGWIDKLINVINISRMKCFSKNTKWWQAAFVCLKKIPGN